MGRATQLLLLFAGIAAGLGISVSCTLDGDGASADAGGDLAARVQALEARADRFRDELDALEEAGLDLKLQVVEDVSDGAAVGEAVCPADTVLVGGGCVCNDPTGGTMVKGIPAHYGCERDDESCVRSFICDCRDGGGTARALCARAEPALAIE